MKKNMKNVQKIKQVRFWKKKSSVMIGEAA